MDLSPPKIDDHGRTILGVSGEIDLATAPQLRTYLIDNIGRGSHPLIVDLSEVHFIDSTGLGVLVGARRRRTEVGGDLWLVIPREPIRALFAATGLDGIFTIFPALPGPQDLPGPQGS